MSVSRLNKENAPTLLAALRPWTALVTVTDCHSDDTWLAGLGVTYIILRSSGVQRSGPADLSVGFSSKQRECPIVVCGLTAYDNFGAQEWLRT